MTKDEAQKRITKLRQTIDYHRYLYHVKDTAEISAAALDSLKKELVDLEARYPDLITADSPTQRVGGLPLPELKQVNHRVPMLSLNDAFSIEDLDAWETRNQKIVRGPYEYYVELKIDGVSAALIYENGVFVEGSTRGDGLRGEDVTHSLRTIEAIPLNLRRQVSGRLEVRGEVYLLKKDFEKMNAEREKKGDKLFANPRNIAAGSIRQLDANVAAARPLRFFAWEITEGLAVKTRAEEIKTLIELGFAVPPESNLYRSLEEVEKFLVAEEKRRDHRPFLVDGAVIKINDLNIHRRLGAVGKAPRGAMAFKFTAEEATTVVEDISVQVGRTGTLTPVAHLRPVKVAGTVVSRATLHNADEVRRKDVRVSDTVIIHKAGDIIPEVVRVLPRLRPEHAQSFSMPAHCPVCGSPVKKDGVAVRCVNVQCFPIQREKILHAVSDAAFDIDGLGDKIVEQLLQEGLIKDPPDLWQLTAGDLMPLERFAEKSAQKLVEEIQAHKEILLSRFLVALSIPHVGLVTAQDIAREFGTLDKVAAADVAAFSKISGVGEKVAPAIVDFFASAETQKLLGKYRAADVKVLREKIGGPLTGKTFVFTGSMPDISRDEAKQRVSQLGGKVASAAGHNVDYVVVGEDAGSKADKARALGLKILTPEQFKRMIQ